MSQHIITVNKKYVFGYKKYVFGWDQMLQSFYLQVHDMTIENPDDRIIAWEGSGGKSSIIYEVDALKIIARKYGLDIPYETQVKLYGEKDDGV